MLIGRLRSARPGIHSASRRLASFGIIAITTWVCGLSPSTTKSTRTYQVHGNEIARTRTYRDAVKHLTYCTHCFCIYHCVSLLPAAPCESVFASARACAAPRGHARSPLPRCAKRTRRIQGAHGIVLACRPAVSAGIAQAPQLDSSAYSLRRKRGLRNVVACMFGCLRFSIVWHPWSLGLTLGPSLSVNVAMSLSPCSATSSPKRCVRNHMSLRAAYMFQRTPYAARV